MAEEQAQWRRLADFVHEVGMLRHTPRTGWPFLGSNSETVAEHCYRMAVIGFLLAVKAGAQIERVVCLCLFHDVHEARTGDFNYLYHRYNTCRDREALADAVAGTGLEDKITALYAAFSGEDSLEAKLARDADQLDFIANLCVERAKGNTFANEWLTSALKRLVTLEGQRLAEALLVTDPNHWWYDQVPKEWWVHHRDPEKSEG